MQIQLTNEAIEHPLIQPLYITLIGCDIKGQSLTINRPQGFDNFVLIYSMSGKCWFQSRDQKKCVIEKNTAILIHPREPYSYGTDQQEPWGYYYIHICGKNAAWYFQNYPRVYIARQDDISLECVQLLEECWKILRLGFSTGNMIYCSQLLGQLLTLLLICKGKSPSRTIRNHAVQSAIQYMLQRIDHQVTLQQLCEVTHLSKTYFVRLFKQNTGFSPIDYFLRLKIQHSCEYLDSTDLSVKEVCYKLGFTDPGYFSRMFTKIMGASPAKYRHR